MFANKLAICTTLLLLNSSVFSQALVSLKDAKFSTTSSSTSTTTNSTTTITTTLKPITSTTSSSTEQPKTTTTTAPVTTTTPVPIPTTTHAPQPYPAPTAGSWNASCILLKMAAQWNFTYEKKDGNLTHGLYNLPSNAILGDHSCVSETVQQIQLNWGPNSSVHSFLLEFDKINGSSVLAMIKVDMAILPQDFPDAKENKTLQLVHRSRDDFKTPVLMSYHCTRAQHFNMTETINDLTKVGTVTISQVQVEAFRQKNATGFSTVHDCDSSETSDVVPIAVGIALAALILVVLISYLCARRRSTSRGYMSF